MFLPKSVHILFIFARSVDGRRPPLPDSTISSTICQPKISCFISLSFSRKPCSLIYLYSAHKRLLGPRTFARIRLRPGLALLRFYTRHSAICFNYSNSLYSVTLIPPSSALSRCFFCYFCYFRKLYRKFNRQAKFLTILLHSSYVRVKERKLNFC